ncbi:MAG: hypothetical protein A2428_05330 [Bdellovibrionales bacterium RIFOXYC1_FULL_54_43]|nr:MAG: hypothetical protein A2428_05330 [Bdellovibrionales bacterium RIFOXYC1_FULL_54_43]OFZ84954.1 MAG: hypothetical protein A2603_05290 [Bdellovibrionales bacterium RIFOXYD1_FULL_55_31]
MTTGHSATLGEFLRQERERRGITLEQVASATKIGIRILHALEADQFVELPAKPFIRGFVTSYVRFIGLDPKEVLTTFGDFIEQKAHDRPSRDEGHSGYAFEKREGEQSRTMLWFVMGGFLVFGAVVFFFLKPSLNRHRGSHVEKLRAAHNSAVGLVGAPSPLSSPLVAPSPSLTQVSSKPSPAPQTVAVVSAPVEKVLIKPSPKPDTKPSPVASATGATASTETNSAADPLNSGLDLKKEEIKQKAVFRALGDVWVRYQVDAKKPKRIILRKDKVLVLRARELIRFQVSDPKQIRFNYNGAPAKIMADEKAAVKRQGDSTLFFPVEVAETIEEPFPDTISISNIPVPAGRVPSPTPSPAP